MQPEDVKVSHLARLTRDNDLAVPRAQHADELLGVHGGCHQRRQELVQQSAHRLGAELHRQLGHLARAQVRAAEARAVHVDALYAREIGQSGWALVQQHSIVLFDWDVVGVWSWNCNFFILVMVTIWRTISVRFLLWFRAKSKFQFGSGILTGILYSYDAKIFQNKKLVK